MRRKDRQVTDLGDILDILSRCDVCRVGFHDEPAPYIVPLNFAFSHIDGELHLYFHCAKQGKKLDLLDQNPNVFYQLDCGHKLVSTADNCTMEYECVMGSGVITRVEAFERKKDILQKLMDQYGSTEWKPTDRQIEGTCVLELTSSAFTAKRLKR